MTEYLSEIAELKAKLQDTEAVRDAFRNDWFALRQEAEDLRAEVEELKAERIEARERESVSLDAGSNAIIGLTAERDQLRAEVKRLTLEVNMDLDRLRAALSVAEADRGKWRGILDEIADVLVGKGVAYSSADFSAQIADLKAERDQLRAEEERLREKWFAERAAANKEVGQLQAEVERLKDAGEKLASSAGADNAPAASVPACSCNRAPQSWTSPTIAWQNALQGIRWALADLGLRVHEMRSVEATAEATMSAVEVLCVHLRKEGRVWTGEMLGGLTCPSQMQKEDNAALKQRVFTALGERLEYDLRRGDPVDPNLIAQYLWGSPQQDDA